MTDRMIKTPDGQISLTIRCFAVVTGKRISRLRGQSFPRRGIFMHLVF